MLQKIRFVFFFLTNEFKRQCVYNACNCLLNGTFPFRLSCYSNQSMISIGVFSGDHVKDIRPQKDRHVPKHKFDNIF
jgi:hypothetical protein